MGVELTIYLLNSSISKLADAVVTQDGSNGYTAVALRPGFSFSTPPAAYVKTTTPKAPDWVAWVDEVFDFGTLKPTTQSSGVVVFLEAGARVFAACFGTGWHAIPDHLLEHDFGLKVALNELDPQKLQGMVTKTIDVRTRERNTHQHSGAGVPDFALDFDVEWLRSAAGKSPGLNCTGVSGGLGLKLHGWKGKLSDLATHCTAFLTSFGKGIPEAFAFADHVRPVESTSPDFAQLESELRIRVKARDFSRISLAIDAKTAEAAAYSRLTFEKKRFQVNELSDEGVRAQVDAIHLQTPSFDPDKVRLKVDNSAGETIRDVRLIDVLQAEADLGGDPCVRVEGRWFKTAASYVARVNDRIAALPKASLSMPVWDKAVHKDEDEYNEHAAKQLGGWLIQDKKLVPVGNGTIEPCDILSPQCQFICVKDGEGSAGLSHLFAQASVSADLLARHDGFRAEVKKRFESHWAGTTFENSGKPVFVLAIARSSKGLFGKMLLSKINALEHVRRINGLGYGVEIQPVVLQ